MLLALFQKFGLGLRHLTPLLSTLALCAISVMAWPFPYVGSVSPALGLIGIFYWAVYRPDLLRPLGAFGLGLVADALLFTPLGLSSLSYVGAYVLVFAQRRFFAGQHFFALWFGFGVLSVAVTAFQALILAIVQRQGLPLGPLMVQCALTVAIFPLPAWGLIRLQRTFLPSA